LYAVPPPALTSGNRLRDVQRKLPRFILIVQSAGASPTFDRDRGEPKLGGG